MTNPLASLLDRLTGQFAKIRLTELGVAVSGGSDSLGLLVLLSDWAARDGPKPRAVTVDHGLRPEAVSEAEHVAGICRQLGISHDVLSWSGWDGTGNLPDEARKARYGLIADWAQTRGLKQVAVAHTLNDQAETFLMRLAREAGVDGLAAMASTWRHGEIEFRRPLLDVSRNELRAVLRARGIAWVDDPTNTDHAFERARARAALDTLAELGLTPRTLCNVAGHMSDVRTTLYWYVFLAARTHVTIDRGDILIDRKGFRTLPRDITRRLVQEVLKWIGGAVYPARGKAVDLMLESIRGGTGMTLQGCVLSVSPDTLRFTREMQAVAGLRVTTNEVWDGRWRMTGPWPTGAYVTCLGEAGLLECPNRAETGLPMATLTASPAIWRDGHLVAAPLAGLGNGWTATLTRDEDMFFAAILSH
ncbi:MAG: tRNA lysidine(34) synthetase TilS [Pseudomonadota bacterium]